MKGPSTGTTTATRSVLVVGATGTVGGFVTRRLVDRGATVRALVRSPERAAGLPAQVVQIVGDLGNPDSVTRALEGVDAALYVSPHDAAEEEMAAAFITACETASARLVLVGVHALGRNTFTRAVMRALYGQLLPHYRPKLRLAERARHSATDAVVLTPGNYYQNDDLFLAEILAGEFVQPIRRLNRVDARDVADVAVRALLEPDFAPGGYRVFGPASLSGAECAAEWSRAVGHHVRYTGGDPARFARAGIHTLTGRKRQDFIATYRYLLRVPIRTTDADIRAVTDLLGRAPRSYADFVHDARTAHAGLVGPRTRNRLGSTGSEHPPPGSGRGTARSAP